jgi:hypothetical protein
MITIAIAALVSAAQITPIAPPEREVRVASASTVAAAVRTVDDITAADHLQSARRALTLGDFDAARREFVIAAALDRDEGKLPVDATLGLVNVLYARSQIREAAAVMDRLATEASERGDADAEARALMDAIWLNIDAGQREQARIDGVRLQRLIKDKSLSTAMLKQVKERYR